MTDINTTIRGGQPIQKENPKSAQVIAKKIGTGLIAICLVVGIFTFSSWQLSIITETVNCLYKNKLDKPCPYPGNENAPPYRSKALPGWNMDPITAFINILMSVFSDGLLGLARGVKCCKKDKIPTMEGTPIVKATPIMKGGGTSDNGFSNINLQFGDMGWKPFDIHSDNIGWPYDEVKSNFPFSFNYWLGSSQIKSWVIPRQLLQATLLFFANLMSPKMGETGAWFSRFIITAFIPLIFGLLYASSHFVSLAATAWGGFFQHLFSGNFGAAAWGFFFTWILMIYNFIIQAMELMASFFIIPWLGGGRSWIKANWQSMNNGGFREIILTTASLAFVGTVLYAFSPLM